MDFLMLIKCSLILLGKSKKPDHSFGFLESVLIFEPVILQFVISIMREMYQLDSFRSCRILLKYIKLKMTVYYPASKSNNRLLVSSNVLISYFDSSIRIFLIVL
jgi:hypothetical protein